MSSDHLVIGHFDFVDDTRSAIVTLRDAGHMKNLELFSPIPSHDLEEEMYRGEPRSPVRMFVLLGALTGCLGAFLMTCWMSIDYPVRVSAKPLISIPSFVVIGFECTVLIGCICNLLSMFHFSRIPFLFGKPGYRPEFSSGTFGLTVRVAKDQADGVKQLLEKSGAQKVEVQYVR